MRRLLLAILVVVATTVAGCRDTQPPSARSSHMDAIPHLMLWAWERPEDLSYIDAATTGVAFLAATVTLRGPGADARPRLQPLSVPPETTMVAVVRVEVDRRESPALSASQGASIVRALVRVSSLDGVAAVQVDFDARLSERDFYRDLLTQLRAALPESMPISMTALASWAMYDDWVVDLPVDEIVPMLFRMGREAPEIRAYIERNGDMRARVPGGSIGYAVDEPRPPLTTSGRVYIFAPDGWSRAGYTTVVEEFAQ
jgi:hypothetical protein